MPFSCVAFFLLVAGSAFSCSSASLIAPHLRDITTIKTADIAQNATKRREISAALSFASSASQPFLFVDVDRTLLQGILLAADFALYPNEQRDYFFVHSHVNAQGLRVYHSKEYMRYGGRHVTATEEGIIVDEDIDSEDNGEIIGPLFGQYLKDVVEYTQSCASASSAIPQCAAYLSRWREENGVADANGMVPNNASSCWGELQQTTYVDDTATTFSSLIPFSVYLYAEANLATQQLQDLLVYIVAQGLHSQTPKCNTGGCRAYAHREIWVNISATPTTAYDIDSYHWVYSQPQTENQQSSVTTGVSDTVSIGVSGSFSADGGSIGFSASQSWTNSYSDTVQVSDFNVIENTSPTTGEGKWQFYEQAPVNILQQPLEDFSTDWESWFSNAWSPCTVVDGPVLAFNSQQTANAIKWQASPAMIDYAAKSLDVVYTVNVMANVDGLWCPDWNGQPANPCNTDGQHHCADWYYVNKRPSWTTNVLQAMNNLS